MSHGLEQMTALDGTTYTAFASRNEIAWHSLGTVFTEKMNANEILSTAHLAGWNVRLQPLQHYMGMVNNDMSQMLQIEGEITDESVMVLAESMPSEIPYTIAIAM